MKRITGFVVVGLFAATASSAQADASPGSWASCLWLLLWLVIGGLVGYFVGRSRGRVAAGVIFGALFGVLGWLLVALGPNHRRQGPEPIRGWLLLVCALGALTLGALAMAALSPWLPGEAPNAPLTKPVFGLLIYGFLLAFLHSVMKRSQVSWRGFFRVPASAGGVRWALVTGIAVFATAVAAIYALYLPLSFVLPDFVKAWLFHDLEMAWSSGDHFLLANCLSFLAVVCLAPLAEELLFRGLLLPAWTERWGQRRAIVWSSMIFAIVHVDLLGAFIFGVVVSLAWLRTRSLWLPLIIHATNNAIAWLVAAIGVFSTDPATATLDDLRSSWWLGLLGLLVGVPLLIFVLRALPRMVPETVVEVDAPESDVPTANTYTPEPEIQG